MSRKDRYDDNQNEAQEPWEQPIYDTDSDDNISRSQQRQQKRGNKNFARGLVILISLIVIVPTATFFWIMHDRGNANSAKTPATSETSTAETSSTAESSTKESESSTAESSTTESSTQETSSSSSEEADNNEEQNQADNNDNQANQNQEENNQTDAASTTTVQAGEGPQNVAARVGITLDQLAQLNGWSDINSVMLHPGDELRIK